MARWNLDYFAGEGLREEIEQRLGDIASHPGIQRFDEVTVTIIAYDADGTQLDTLTIDAPPSELADAFGAQAVDDVVYAAHLVEGRYDEPKDEVDPLDRLKSKVQPASAPATAPAPAPAPKQDQRGRYLPGQSPKRGAGGRFVSSGKPKRPYVPVAERRRRAEERKKEQQRRRRNERARQRRAEKKRANK
jgi:hypothetical protein